MWENYSGSAQPLFTIAPPPPRATASASPVPSRPAARADPTALTVARAQRVAPMTSSKTVTIEVAGPMIPSQPPPGKRKATEDVNPLAATAGKKLKREVRWDASASTNTRSNAFLCNVGLESRLIEQTQA